VSLNLLILFNFRRCFLFVGFGFRKKNLSEKFSDKKRSLIKLTPEPHGPHQVVVGLREVVVVLVVGEAGPGVNVINIILDQFVRAKISR
jgi:hypothetical protein